MNSYRLHYKCALCPWDDGDDYYNYTQHLKVHHILNNDNLRCYECNLNFHFLNEFVLHLYKKHTRRLFKCPCGIEFITVDGVKDHMDICVNLNGELCSNCNNVVCFCVRYDQFEIQRNYREFQGQFDLPLDSDIEYDIDSGQDTESIDSSEYDTEIETE